MGNKVDLGSVTMEVTVELRPGGRQAFGGTMWLSGGCVLQLVVTGVQKALAQDCVWCVGGAARKPP